MPPTRLLLALLAASAGAGWVRGATIPAELFDPGFLAGDSNYHSLTAASDGNLYFTIGTHHADESARIYRFEPGREEITELARINDVLGQDPAAVYPHGKIHTPLIEHEGSLYFATHTSLYDGSLPDLVPEDDREPYPGGHFMRYDLASGHFESLARLPLPSEGIITLALDPVRGRLLGLTWPSGLLFALDLESRRLLHYGAVQGRGEWGQLGNDWDFICRRLGVDPTGRIYGSTNDGRLWSFEAAEQRPVTYLEGLRLDTVPAVAEADFRVLPEPHHFWRNWRTILWNPATASFWGLHGGSTQLFEFDPAARSLRSVASLRARGVSDGRRNPFRTQLGFMLGPENTLFYLAHGPALERPGRPTPKANVYLLTYDIETGTVRDHGPVLGPDDRRVFFTESLELGPDGHLYTVAWVETLDPARKAAVQDARGDALPAETREVIYEIQLVRLPPVDRFLHP
ncbi:MAG: hypothetical protein ACLFU2_14290 [Opitutales bacterium]